RIAGVVTTAPPMPNIPDSTPETTPIATVSANCSTTGTTAQATRRVKLAFDKIEAASSLRHMASDLHLHGVWIPLITPFDTSGAVAVEAVERLCHEYLADGAAGIVALGTTGESPALDADEKRAVVDACARACSARGAPLIVGTGTNNTRATIAATRALADVSA